ncbi:MAG: DUF5602 domain-containing protein [Bryobacteraceae bacterium]|nr:DUF5602 domain-containing protein [Bryobacteraceae bacterium]
MTTPTRLIGFLTASVILLPALQPSLIAQTGATETIVGEEKAIGNGKVRTWLKVDAKTREPRVLGVTLTEAGLSGLPQDGEQAQPGSVKLRLMDGGPNHTFEYELKFPPEAEETAFNHMGFNWNPEGHGPKGIFTKAHFDVHFYMATPEYRHHIHVDLQDADPTHLKTSNLEPPSEFLPPDYQLAPNTAEPRMGSHYADVTSDQLKPGNFANIFLIGAHGGSILFWEPMITREYLLSKPKSTSKLKLPESYPVSGYYPTAYSVVYDSNRREFDISLDGLTFRLSSYPKNVYGVEPCIDSRVAQIISKYNKVPDNPATRNCVSLLQKAISAK